MVDSLQDLGDVNPQRCCTYGRRGETQDAKSCRGRSPEGVGPDPGMTHPRGKLTSIVVLNWQGWRDTLTCLASLQKLRYPHYEVIAVDNGSEDDSVAQIRTAYPHITVLETEYNRGFAGGNNVGIRHALSRGASYIWLLNNDTVVDPDSLEAMVAVAEADAGVGAVGVVLYDMSNPEHIQVWGGGRVNMWLGRSRYCTTPAPPDRLDYVTGASLFVRREVFRSKPRAYSGVGWRPRQHVARAIALLYDTRTTRSPGLRDWGKPVRSTRGVRTSRASR